MSIFAKITGAASEFQALPEGKHNVVLTKYAEIDSFTNHDGTAKDHNHEYADSTPQFIITCKSIDGKGSIMHRLNGCGFLKYSELTDAQIKSGNYHDCEGYACIENKQGLLVRILHKERTAIAERMFAEFLFATSGLDGDISGLEDVVADAEPFTIKVTTEVFDKKPHAVISNFYPYSDIEDETVAATAKKKQFAE